MKVTNYAWREMTLLEQEELRQGAYDEFVDSELELNKYKKLVNSFYETVSVNCTDVGETLAGMQNDIDQLRKETFPVNRTTNRYDPNSRHTVIGGR